MWLTIEAHEAMAHLATLLAEVTQGRTVVITKHGKPVAMMVPYREAERDERRQVVEAMRELAKDVPSWDGVSYRELIDAGRRF